MKHIKLFGRREFICKSETGGFAVEYLEQWRLLRFCFTTCGSNEYDKKNKKSVTHVSRSFIKEATKLIELKD